MDLIRGSGYNVQSSPTNPIEATQAAGTHWSGQAIPLTAALLSDQAVATLNAKQTQGNEKEKMLAGFAKLAIESDQLQLSPNQHANGIAEFRMQRNQGVLAIKAKLNERSEYDVLEVDFTKDSEETVSLNLRSLINNSESNTDSKANLSLGSSSSKALQEPVQQNLLQSITQRSLNQIPKPHLPQADILPGQSKKKATNSIQKDFTVEKNESFSIKIFNEINLAYQAGSKSDNIRGDGTEEQARCIEAQRKLKIIRKKNRTNSIKGERHAPEILKIDAANCGELAKIAAQKIINSGGYAEVWGFSKADHQFAVMGKPPTGISGRNMSSWKGLQIIDVWAGIVTEAPNYYETFLSQMHKMAIEGKEIRLKNDSWVKPDDESWLIPIRERKQIVKSTPYLSNPNPWEYLSLTVDDSQVEKSCPS